MGRLFVVLVKGIAGFRGIPANFCGRADVAANAQKQSARGKPAPVAGLIAGRLDESRKSPGNRGKTGAFAASGSGPPSQERPRDYGKYIVKLRRLHMEPDAAA
jgi:hypothetical protein